MLMLWRREGMGAYIGRTARLTVLAVSPEQVSVALEAPLFVAVSGPNVTAEDHLVKVVDREREGIDGALSKVDVSNLTLRKGERAQLGRTIKLEYRGMDAPGVATIGVAAPRHVAISRDDFTREQHMEFQLKREAGAVAEV